MNSLDYTLGLRTLCITNWVDGWVGGSVGGWVGGWEGGWGGWMEGRVGRWMGAGMGAGMCRLGAASEILKKMYRTKKTTLIYPHKKKTDQRSCF